MLTTLVVDKLLLEKGITDRASRKNQELAAGGVANAGVAFFGGIPGTVC
jgi:MFS superfamily sulfate permease-like transporter